ncbi:glycosyltransferase family 4 protein [Algoriphagus hitonicola]|uniref:Glycosyltransferase involved in cell wall bisynthesis n=1 Tax=Algoriphagus hitonicola TaxID=435880 RepID=A0A1I2S7X3_9BACT|nr:glycosyltransferase family 4 protein [Algoriphagus hitonicola]SFG48995.1 Glycosyltransferase involved in cell wall bisynthesis [Algoriphagus hitonicola]
MKILALHSGADLYGSSRIFLETLSVFRQQRIEILVILPHSGPLVKKLEELGVEVQIKNLGILRRKYFTSLGLFNRLKRILQAYRFFDRLHQRHQFDVVYSNTLAVTVGAFWAKRNQIPHSWHIHEIIPGPKILLRFLVYLLDQSTPQPIAVSQAVANHWQRRLKISQVKVIHNGLAYDTFLSAKAPLKMELNLAEKTLLIGMIGRINPGKGQVFFLQLAEKLLSAHQNLHFVLVGDPYPGYESILEKIRKEIRNNKLEARISYLGFRRDIPEVMASLDIFVLPSILPDSFPTVILEAMAAGKPIVATQSGGASEMVISGETGFLIPIGDVESGVNGLEKLILDEQLRESMGEKGRNRVLAEFSLEAFKEKIQNHLWQQLRKN